MAKVKKPTVLRMLFCDFCGRAQSDCVVLVEGRDGVHICESCAPKVLEMVTDYIASLKPRIEEASADGGTRQE